MAAPLCGIDQLAQLQGKPAVALLGLVCRHLHGDRIEMVYPPNRHLNARVRAFADWAIALFGSTPALQAREPLPAVQEPSTTLH